MAWEMSILHSMYQYTCFSLNVGQMVNITASERVMNSKHLLRVCYLLLLDETLCTVWVGYKHFLVGCFCVFSFALHALII